MNEINYCNFLILSQELHHKNRYWHEDCFRCAKCYKPLASEPFSARDDGKIMCGKCGAREDGNRCQGCYKVVMPGERGLLSHDLCCRCAVNKLNLISVPEIFVQEPRAWNTRIKSGMKTVSPALTVSSQLARRAS